MVNDKILVGRTAFLVFQLNSNSTINLDWWMQYKRDYFVSRKFNSQLEFNSKFLTFFFRLLRACLVHVFKHMFSVFKQYYTYFYTLFHLSYFQKNWKLLFKYIYQTNPKYFNTHKERKEDFKKTYNDIYPK